MDSDNATNVKFKESKNVQNKAYGAADSARCRKKHFSKALGSETKTTL